MRPTAKTLVASAAVLALALAAPAWAGGDKCRDDAARATKTAHHDKAAKTEAMKQAGWTGFETEKDEAGAYRVVRVHPATPAATADVRVGDRVVAYQGIALAGADKEALHAAKKGRKVGARVTYTLERAGAPREVVLTLVEVPQPVLARWLAEAEAETVAAAGGG
jgi:C-terminal processing protease CtpA/Prc